MHKKLSFINILLIKLILIYQIIKNNLKINKTCRFYPTCSDYAIESFKKYNFFKSIFLIIKRILKCNPFNKGEIDYLK